MRKLLAMAGIGVLSAACSNGQGAEDKRPAYAHDFVRYAPGRAPLDFIKIDTVKETAAATLVTLPARVAFDEDRTQRVASPIDGRAIKILVKLGDKVRAGQPLIALSSPNVGQIQADAQKALSDLGLAEKAVERVHKLQAEGAVADKEVAQAEGDLRKARSDYGRASVQLRALGISPSDPAVNAALHAQIGGNVVERNVLVGQEVRADQATPLLTISSLDSVWVLADVYEQDLGLVTEGDSVSVQLAAYPGEKFPGKITHVGDVVDPTTRTVKLRCVVANPAHRLKPEMFAKVEVQNDGRRKALTIPSKAVLSQGDKSFVIVAIEGNVFKLRRIDVASDNEGSVRIAGGLVAGERIVTDGAIFMKREIETQ